MALPGRPLLRLLLALCLVLCARGQATPAADQQECLDYLNFATSVRRAARPDCCLAPVQQCPDYMRLALEGGPVCVLKSDRHSCMYQTWVILS